MAFVIDLLQIIRYDVLEDPGFSLGIITEAQFLTMLNEALSDLITGCCLTQRVFTTTVFAGQGLYQIPDDLLRVESVFLGGRWLPKSTQREMSNSLRNWRRAPGPPQFWYEDGLPSKTIGVAPAPDFNSSYIIGPNEPDGPHAVYDSFSAMVLLPSGQAFQNPAQHRGLTVIGPNQNVSPISATNQSIPTLPNDFAMAYLGFGVLQRIFSSDSELVDQQKAMFCGAQVKEGISLARAITSEPEDS